MPSERVKRWFQVMGGLTVITGIYFGISLFQRVSHSSGRDAVDQKVLFSLVIASVLSFILCGLIIFLLASYAGAEDKRAQVIIRLCSLSLFIWASGLLYIGQRSFWIYTFLTVCAINLIGLCPICGRRKKALFSPESEESRKQ